MVLVSVIIPTFNRYTFVLRAVHSVLQQTHKEVEILVIDDASTDEDYKFLPDVLKPYSNVQVIRCPVNLRTVFQTKHAQGETRNVGLKVAKGEYVAFLDDDDFWLPTKLQTQLQQMNKYPDHKLCSTNAITGHGLSLQTYGNLYFHTPLGHQLDEQASSFDLAYISETNYIMNSSVIMHKSIVDTIGYLTTIVAEDWDYWKRSLVHTKCLYLKEPLIGYDMGHGFGKAYDYGN